MGEEIKDLVEQPTNTELIISDHYYTKNLIRNKDKYTKLIYNDMYYSTNMKEIKKFKNVREIVINGELHIGKYYIPDYIGKITIGNDSASYFNAPENRVKCIEFSENTKEIDQSTIKCFESLENIIFDMSNNSTKRIRYGDSILVNTNYLKTITIRYNNKEYKVNLDYIPKNINKVNFDNGKICIEYSNEYIRSKAIIKNDKLTIENEIHAISNNLVNNNCLYIPDYITNINLEDNKTVAVIDSISMNENILNGNSTFENNTIDYNVLSKIILRSNNDMSLMKEKEFTKEQYGKFENIYIKDNSLYIVLKNGKTKLQINSNGNIEEISIPSTKIEQQINKELATSKKHINTNPQQDIIDIIDNYSSSELEKLSCYKKLAEYFQNSNNKEVDEALKVIKKNLINDFKRG